MQRALPLAGTGLRRKVLRYLQLFERKRIKEWAKDASRDSLKQQATQWQTNLLNVAREYVQNLFLSHLYGFPESDTLVFKGGTALRILYGSPRFSEDLDFTGHLKPFHLARLLKETAGRMEKESLSFETLEAKPTSGGFLALYEYRVHEELVRLELNVSLRNKCANGGDPGDKPARSGLSMPATACPRDGHGKSAGAPLQEEAARLL